MIEPQSFVIGSHVNSTISTAQTGTAVIGVMTFLPWLGGIEVDTLFGFLLFQMTGHGLLSDLGHYIFLFEIIRIVSRDPDDLVDRVISRRGV